MHIEKQSKKICTTLACFEINQNENLMHIEERCFC